MLALPNSSLSRYITRRFPVSLLSTACTFVFTATTFLGSTERLFAQKTTAFLPEGPTIVLDSLFKPNAPYPFDRKFRIEMPMPSDGRLQYFSMTPINGRGEVDIKQRDRRKFLRLMYPEPVLLDSMLRNPFFSLNNIRKRSQGLLFDIPKGKPTTGKTKLTLPILPLDPNREYKLTLFGTDQLMAEQYIDIVRKVLSSKDKLASGDAMAAHVLMREAEIDYFKSSSEFRNRSTFDPTTFQQYISELTAFRFTITPTSSRKSAIKEYDLFITSKKDAPVADDFAAEVNIYKEKFVAQPSPQRLKLSFPATDTYGNEIQQFQQGQFTMQLLTCFEDGTTTLGDLGVLNISHDYLYTFRPATPAQGTTYVSLDADPTINIVRELYANENLLAQGFQQLGLPSHKGALSVLLNYVDQCPCSDKVAVDQAEKKGIFRSLGVFFDGSQELVIKVVQGLLTLADPTRDPVKADSFADRASNIESSIKEIARLTELVRKYMAHNPSAETEMRSLLSYLHHFRDNLVRSKSVLSDVIKKRELLKENFANRFNLMVAQEIFSGSTSTLNMVSDAKLRIIPEIGFVALFNNDKWYSYQDFAPYLGFQIGFRPIDKNIPFRLIRDKSIWHFLTFKAGITLTSLEIEGRRTDFFGKNSLMTGIGIRLGRFFSISPGVVWCKAVDPSPLSTRKITQASPSFALSADFELRDLFEGFNRLFK